MKGVDVAVAAPVGRLRGLRIRRSWWTLLRLHALGDGDGTDQDACRESLLLNRHELSPSTRYFAGTGRVGLGSVFNLA
jgi:hypothetical protein